MSTDKESDPLLSLKRSRASDISWAKTSDWSARTAEARKAADKRFLTLAGGDVKRAEALRRAHFKNMILKSVAARKAKAAQQAKNSGPQK